jgi:hypothetical protein
MSAIAGFALWLLASSAGAVSDPEAGAIAIDGSITIYVARRQWHIDIGFAAADLTAPLNSVTGKFPEVRYLFFGFGDRRYLMAKNHHLPALLSAIWPGTGIMLVTGLRASPNEAFGAEHVIEIRATARQARALQSFIWGSFATQDGAAAVYAAGPYRGSLYFGATPVYSGLHTCNTWAAEVLEAGGLRVSAAGVILAGQLWTRARRASQRASSSGPQTPAQIPAEPR